MDDLDELGGVQPSVEVSAPGGTSTTVQLHGERATVGRFPAVNDIVLEPDPDRYVSGKWHCLIERDGRGWRVVDNASANGTLLRRGDHEMEVRDPQALSDGDVICILASLSASAGPSYWELVFRNPAETVRVAPRPGSARLEYDWVSARLYRIAGTARKPVTDLSPQVHRLLRHMLSRNRANGDAAVLCSHDELMHAIWGDEQHHRPREELNGLIFQLRKRVELDSRDPRFVQTVPGLGYRLDSRPSER